MTERPGSNQPAARQPDSAPPEVARWLSPELFTIFRDLLADYSGVHLDVARQRLLEQSLIRRLEATGESLGAYQRRLGGPEGRAELGRLSELVLNHETTFFRNAPHFHALQSVLLPELHQRKPLGAPIRIWSAGCATGEEAYSLAIAALEVFGQPLGRPVEILATDLSEPALQKARAGIYRGRALHNVAPETLRRYFTPSGDGYAVGDAARALVRFEQLNLLEPFPRHTQGVDIVFCQNVTIYFQLKTCQALIARFYECLPAGGLLFLGFSETLWNIFDHFLTREVAGAYVYFKGTSRSAAAGTPKPAADARQPTRREPSGRTAPLQPVANLPRRGVTLARPPAFHDHAGRDAASPTDRELLARGHELLNQGRFDKAMETLRHIPLRSATAAEALTLIARVHADRGDLDLATAEVQRAIELDTLYHEAYVLLGIIASRQQQWPTAIQQLERARYLNADAALVSFHLAEAYRQGGRIEKAVLEYRNTLQKLERHPPGELLDGVAVGWLRETCQRQLELIPRSSLSKLGA